MRMIVGLDAPTAGSVTVNGRRYREHRAPLHEVGAYNLTYINVIKVIFKTNFNTFQPMLYQFVILLNNGAANELRRFVNYVSNDITSIKKSLL